MAVDIAATTCCSSLSYPRLLISLASYCGNRLGGEERRAEQSLSGYSPLVSRLCVLFAHLLRLPARAKVTLLVSWKVRDKTDLLRLYGNQGANE